MKKLKKIISAKLIELINPSIEQQLKDSGGALLASAYEPFNDVDNFAYKFWCPQSIAFAKEMFPEIMKTVKAYVNKNSVGQISIADVGGGIGSGSEYIRAKLQMEFCEVEVCMTVIDINGRFREWCNRFSPKISFVNQDVFSHREKYDFIICSHTIEHIIDVFSFVGRMKQMSKHKCFIYAPYKEFPLYINAGHINTIDDSFIASLNPLSETHILSEGYSQKDCVFLVLPGEANDKCK